MPNWVMNEISVKSNEDYAKLLNATSNIVPAVAYKNGFTRPMINYMDLNKIIPCPDTIYQGNLGRDEEELYGKENCWYDWNVNNWGTKWNTNADNVYLGDNNITFTTAWSPVPRVIGILSQKLGIDIDYKYAEEGGGSYTGDINFKNGYIDNIEYHDHDYKAYKNYLDLWGDDEGTAKILVKRNGYELVFLQCPVVRYYSKGE